MNPTVAGGGADIVWSAREGATDRQTYDDFQLTTSAAVRTIEWQGTRWLNRASTRFYVAIMPDGGDRAPARQYEDQRPRALWSAYYSNDQANERHHNTLACPNSPQEQCGWYDYFVTLATPFNATAGTRYWIMIQSESPPTATAGWSWRKGSAINGYALTNLAGTTFPWDMAFALRQ